MQSTRMESAEPVHPDVLEEKTPALIASLLVQVQDFIVAFGWYILGAVILSTYIWSKYIDSAYKRWKQKRDNEEYAAKYHKNPDVFLSRQEAMEAARRKMQEEHDRQAQEHAEKAKQRDELKREEWLARQVGSSHSGQRLGGEERQATPSAKKTSSFRPEYNPLMGSGGSSGYRPPKRGCPGGGCGKK